MGENGAYNGAAKFNLCRKQKEKFKNFFSHGRTQNYTEDNKIRNLGFFLFLTFPLRTLR